ncbi:MAG: spore cortex-lytic protein [Ruminococcaceae bacterium]|nr:spore cortex-lytic protein [Oscillospiraceae bacterium]
MPTRIPYIPETITVHLGPPDSPAQNVTVPFVDYIKNVASSEIYPTWPESALRANILAQISFALNRVYTEYYRSRGYDFNITNSTAIDQSFVNGRSIFDSISRVVDDIFTDYLRRQTFVEPLFARYCNGTTVTCEGLSQWGSVDLAEDGQNSVQILKNYYGEDIEIVTDAPVRGLTSSLPVRNLTLGTTGNDVQSAQIRLNRISVNYPSIPKIANPNGYFGIETRDAVREFQSIFDLEADGIIGPATWYRIQQIYASVKRLNELNSEGLTYGEISRVFPETLGPGAEGDAVRVIQYMLNYVAQYEDTLEPFPLSGSYDKATEAAVRGFQRTYGLPDTGIVNDKTYARLFDVYNALILSLSPSLFEASARPYPGYILSPGFEGDYVTYLQEYLVKIAASFPAIPAPSVSGVYDAATTASVRAFQEFAGLPVTGAVNLASWNAIAELYNDVVAGETVQTDQYPGYIID